jgi:shikimate dehydrogenase
MNTRAAEANLSLLGIVGHRIGHTLSPAMHTAAFRHLGLPYRYGVFDADETMLGPLLRSLRTLKFRGANVTVPYKQAVIPHLDNLSEEAEAIGAVNIIVNNGGVLEGHNTDVYGVRFALQDVAEAIRGSSAVVFGAGGGARAVLFALSHYFSPAEIVIVNRTAPHAAALTAEIGKRFPGVRFRSVDDASSAAAAIANCTLIVNATTVGMAPQAAADPLPQGVVMKDTHVIFDIVYTPFKTQLIHKAERSGARTIPGVAMLLGQGEEAFRMFTGEAFPVSIARDALMRELLTTAES